MPGPVWFDALVQDWAEGRVHAGQRPRSESARAVFAAWVREISPPPPPPPPAISAGPKMPAATEIQRTATMTIVLPS